MFLAFLRRGPPVGRGLERDAAARAGVDVDRSTGFGGAAAAKINT